MALRVFTCKSCEHHMRMSGQVCHACYASKSGYQTPQLFWLSVIVAVVSMIGGAVAVF
jgi:hypothetical protein